MSVDLNALGKGIHRHIQEQDFQFGVEAERERIIKLLEERLYPIYYPKSKLTGGGEGELIGEIIALIRGEKVSGYQK